jgi:hypothetical protein
LVWTHDRPCRTGQAPPWPSDDGQLAGVLLLTANVLGASLVVTQAQQARATPPGIERPDRDTAHTADLHTGR